MNQQDIQNVLTDLARPYADGRVNVFEVELAELSGDLARLRGRVLEEANLQTLTDGLSSHFLGLQVDVADVEVGRKTPPKQMSVATNLTSMHASTSFLAEMVTQMLNGQPVEVLWQKENWGFVRQTDGYLGWTYLPYLTDAPAPRPTHLVTTPVGLLRESARQDAPLLTRVLGGTAVCSAQEMQGWSRLEMAGGLQGWLLTEGLRPLDALPREAGARRVQMAADAFTMIGVPYLWGGSSAHGIDCSGFAQLLHRWMGITLPRDADMQFEAGQPVEPPFEPGDLVFFGERGEKRRITHVTVSLGGWQVIHSSRSRNGVQVDDVQSVPHLRDSYLCAATYIGR